ncbi:MPH1 [Candida theae]|uniref:ATP-dependent DNA helicase n=1 Tax=Candida theae TaxID=1198502 RepID=A0AAD5BC40_9ASCO|nr:MPH1 [Candida theae]KAI5953053.1 MPH1 [Candida theae]
MQIEDVDDDWAFSDDDNDPVIQDAINGGQLVEEQPKRRKQSSQIRSQPLAISKTVSSKKQATINNTTTSLSTSPTSKRKVQHALPLAPKIVIPTHHEMDFGNLQTYIYPTNFEVRDYQYNIVRKAFYDNLLVALPTGLGKTFIASTVMLNFLRWFPSSKIIFMAPTKPLVAQQIKACCSITGISSSKVAILLEKTKKNREDIWNTRQVFFTTPQVVENDLASGVVNPKSIVLLVIDEAHRARGNYSYNNVVNFLRRFNDSFRTLALTATPAADVEGVQDVIDNLKISKVEVRTEQSIDIVKYMKRKKISRRTLDTSQEIRNCVDLLSRAIAPILKTANEKGLVDVTDPTRINAFKCMEASRRLMANHSIPEGLKWTNYFILQLLGTVGQCYRRLNIYGVNSFYSYFMNKFQEFDTKWKKKKSKNKLNADFYYSEFITQLIQAQEDAISSQAFSHPKIEALMEELEDFFKEKSSDASSRVIIFTEFRESALEIVKSIEKAGNSFKPHIFIGQAKEKEKFDVENFGKKKGAKNKKPKKEGDERDSSRTSSENAQIGGMNQKLQKEIIKKFKAGEYNILVATSIGEEGLDIGEVDLIVCYDSTSSPIKNIQRMGRTGRKRDGKVLLLFSSNEESKFDKAMAGYEYIQDHIMKGDLITLCPQNRIIPDQYTPQVVEKFIEIPEENMEMKQEEDEDEIIKIATQYMTGNTSKKKAAFVKKQQKHAKKFFMPDNVETGFKNVSEMLKDSSDQTMSVRVPLGRGGSSLELLKSDSDDDIEVALGLKSKTTKRNCLELYQSAESDNKVDITMEKQPGSCDDGDVVEGNYVRHNDGVDSDIEITMERSLENDDHPTTVESNMVLPNGAKTHIDNHTPSTSFNSETGDDWKRSVSDPGVVKELDIVDDDSFTFSDEDDDAVAALASVAKSNGVQQNNPLVSENIPKTLGLQKQPHVLNCDHLPKKRMLICEEELESSEEFSSTSTQKRKSLGVRRPRVVESVTGKTVSQTNAITKFDKPNSTESTTTMPVTKIPVVATSESTTNSTQVCDEEYSLDDDLDDVIAHYTGIVKQ